MTERTYTADEVSIALNRAADDVLDATEAGDEGLRDALNLVVNAASSYLRGTASTLDEVAAENYSEDLGTILGWIAQGVR